MSHQKKCNVAVVGATGAVGNEMIRVLEERKFPVDRITLLASERSEGVKLFFNGSEEGVRTLQRDSFKGIDIALFSAGASRSLEFAPLAVESGAVVVDNSSAFRMDPKVPLVVPEVNSGDIPRHRGIIANPNCSTIQMVMALKPIHDRAKIRRIVVSTYQAVSGAGKKAIEELREQSQALLNHERPQCRVYPHPIAFNILPHIDTFEENGYTREEMKMVNETRKILGDDSLAVTATAARVPVFFGHSESVAVETREKITVEEARVLLSGFPGVTLMDDPERDVYPLAAMAAGKDDVFVGRIREDLSLENGLQLWIVSDNIRKGAALNAVQIAEKLL